MKRYWYITPEDYEVAKRNGIKRDTVNQRVRRFGWDIDRAITVKPRRVDIPKDLLKKAKEIGIQRYTIINRIRDGWSMEEACTTEVGNVGRPKIHPEWVYKKAKENNIKASALNHRINRGWDLERACTEKTKDKKEVVKIMREYKKSN